MGRRRRGTDWEGLIRAVGALLVLGVGFSMFSGNRIASPASDGVALVGAFLFQSVFWLLLIFLILVVIGAVGFALFKFLTMASSHRLNQTVTPTLISHHTATPIYNQGDTMTPLDALDWHQLEYLVGALFRAGGCHVEMRGGANADGGIDLVVTKDEVAMPVQCKHWKTWTCGVGVVREFLGAMKVGGFNEGYVVSREFSTEARELAAAHGVALIDRASLIEWVDNCLEGNSVDVEQALFQPEKLCPKCGSQMVLRTATRGKSPGSQFWGCSRYPDCKQTLNL